MITIIWRLRQTSGVRGCRENPILPRRVIARSINWAANWVSRDSRKRTYTSGTTFHDNASHRLIRHTWSYVRSQGSSLYKAVIASTRSWNLLSSLTTFRGYVFSNGRELDVRSDSDDEVYFSLFASVLLSLIPPLFSLQSLTVARDICMNTHCTYTTYVHFNAECKTIVYFAKKKCLE